MPEFVFLVIAISLVGFSTLWLTWSGEPASSRRPWSGGEGRA